MSSLSIITPVFNEEDIVVSSILETYTSCYEFIKDIEYIIVNDGSVDNSLKLIEENFNLPNFKIINKQNGGFGSAIKVGIGNAKYDLIVCVPADSPLDKITAKNLLTNIGITDIIVSYRKERLGYSKWMLFNSWIYHRLVSFLFKVRLKDYNWIHLYKRTIFNNINIESNGIFMLAEVLIKAQIHNFTIKEVQVQQRQRLTGIATASKPSAILKTLIEMFTLYKKQLFHKC